MYQPIICFKNKSNQFGKKLIGLDWEIMFIEVNLVHLKKKTILVSQTLKSHLSLHKSI